MKTRMRFVKCGSMKFIGHLDCMRFFQKAIRRAKLDVAYSKGYSPHQLMSFASPLGVGVTSDGEYIDVEFYSLPDLSLPELVTYLNQFMTDEIFVTDIEIMPDGFGSKFAFLCGFKLSLQISNVLFDQVRVAFGYHRVERAENDPQDRHIE